MRLSWADTNVNPRYYELLYYETNYNGAGYYEVAWLSSSVTSYVDASLVAGMTRHYRIVVGLPDGDSLWSSFATATTPLPEFNLPQPWTLGRIGADSVATATVSERDRTFSVWDSNSSLGPATDNCSGVFRPLVGDGAITARFLGALDANGITYPNGKFGIMIRQSLQPFVAAAAAIKTIAPSYSSGFMSRTAQGASSSTNFVNNYGASWLRLVRAGSAVAGYRSIDGTTWTELGSAFVSITPAGG